MPWALVFAADMAAGFTLEPNNLRKNEMMGDGLNLKETCNLSVEVAEIEDFM